MFTFFWWPNVALSLYSLERKCQSLAHLFGVLTCPSFRALQLVNVPL